jgi:translation initiation factor IF-3
MKEDESLNRSFRGKRQEVSRYVVGYQIRASHVICIDSNNENLGKITFDKAMSIAKSAGLDLVMVSKSKDGIPTCRILDFGKYKYEQDKREKIAKKRQRENAVKIKEIKLRPSTGDNDLQTKARQMQEFIEEGNRLKVSVMFRGRELCHQDVGLETLKRFISMIDSACMDGEPMMNGRNLTAIIVKGSDEERKRA